MGEGAKRTMVLMVVANYRPRGVRSRKRVDVCGVAGLIANMIKTRRMTKLMPIPTPGKILLEDFLKPSGESQNALARAIGVSTRRTNEIVLGKRAITADTDLRLARYYKTSEGLFLGLQADDELRTRSSPLMDPLLSHF
jgi:antitoxin HigA-1